MSHTDVITTTLFYLRLPEDGSKPYSSVTVDPVTGKRDSNWASTPHAVQIENVRGKEESVGLDTTGFFFGKHATKHTSFTNDDEIKQEYYPESIELVKEITGARQVHIFDHTVRRRDPAVVNDTPQNRQPASLAHVDQTPKASHNRVHYHLPTEAPELVKRRFQIINLWRPIRVPAHDWPLALCDYRSIDVKKDLVPVTLKYPDREGETFGVNYNPDHKWKYVKGLTPDEFILIKCFDSQDDSKTALLTPHTAFADPTTPPDAPLRESIELRMLVFYD